MPSYLSIGQIIVATLLVIFILLQQRGTALGAAFGGGGEGMLYTVRRGLQKKLYWATIVLGAIFIVLALIRLVLH